MTHLFDSLNAALISAAAEPWVLVAVFAFITIDGFFPPVPSESLVVALAALAVSTGSPDLWLLLLVSTLGAALGDNIAFWLGRRIGIDQRAWAARPRVARLIQTARRTLQRRPAALIVSARYVPIGRVAVNMTAGATAFPWRRFLPLSLIGAATWAAYSVLIGAFAGAWVRHSPLLATVVAIVVAVLFGVAIDHLSRRIRRARVARLRTHVRSLQRDPQTEPDRERTVPEP